MACAMRSLPRNGGNPFRFTAPGAFQPDCSRVTFGTVLHRRLHQPRPLSASRQAYCPGHRFL